MKKETFEKAAQLEMRVRDISTAIDLIQNDKQTCSGKIINSTYFLEDDYVAFRESAIAFLKKRKNELQKQFDNLK